VETDDESIASQIRACHGQYVGVESCPKDVTNTVSTLDTIPGIREIYDDTDENAMVTRVKVEGCEVIVTGAMM
jgi:hypothetical protein